MLCANTSWYILNFRASSILAFKKMGYEVICVCPRDEHSKKLVNKLNVKWVDIKLDNSGSNPVKDILFFYRLLKIFCYYKPQTIFNFTVKNNVYGTWAAKLAKVRVVNNVSGLGTAFINTGLTSFIVRCLYKMSQPFADKVFCQNEEDYQLLIKNNLVPQHKLELLPGSGVDVTRFTPEKRRDDNRDKFVFLYVGRMLADKGLNELVQAAEILFNKGFQFEVWLCGFAGAKNNSAISDELLQEWNKREYVNYIGPSDEVEIIYAAVDCVVLPSYREGMPRSLLEAGAMGLPSIATDVPGCRHIITDGVNGLLCEVKNAESLALKMEEVLLTSEEKLSLYGFNARKRVEQHFDENIVINKYVKELTQT